MSITTNTMIIKTDKPFGGTPFNASVYTADISGCEIIVAAPTSPQAIFLKRLIIRCASAITVTIGEGKSGSGVTAIKLGPIPFSTASPPFEITFKENTSMLLTAGLSLAATASGSGAVMIYAEGEIA